MKFLQAFMSRIVLRSVYMKNLKAKMIFISKTYHFVGPTRFLVMFKKVSVAAP